jgi:hypothetical protein
LKQAGTFFLKRDSLKIGIILGLVMPVLIFVFIYFLRFSGFEFNEFTRLFFTEKKLITFFGVWCLVGNIALFTIYINSGRDQTAKGIFAMTVLYGIGVLLLKALL